MTETKRTEQNPLFFQQVPIAHSPEDEINLVDLLRVLVRRRWVFLAAFLAGLTASLPMVFQPPNHIYRASVEIGSVPEDVNTTAAKVNNGYISKVLAELFEKQPEYDRRLKLEAYFPPGSQLLVIEGKGPLKYQQIYLHAIGQVLELLFQDHQRALDTARAELETQLQAAKSKLQGLLDQKHLLQTKLQSMDDLDRILEVEIGEIRQRLQQSQERYRHITSIKDPSTAMTMLLIDNQIQQDRDRLYKAQKRQISQKNKRQQLNQQIAANDRNIELQKLKLAKIETLRKNMRVTRALVPPMRIPESVGMSRPAKVALGLGLSLILGVIAAFCAEFLARAEIYEAFVGPRTANAAASTISRAQ